MARFSIDAFAGGLAKGIESEGRMHAEAERTKIAKEDAGLRRRRAEREDEEYQRKRAAWEGAAQDIIEATSRTQESGGDAGLQPMQREHEQPEEGASWSQGITAGARFENTGKQAGAAIYRNPSSIYDNPDLLNKIGTRFIAAGVPEGAAWLQAGFKAHKEGEFPALALAAQGDLQGAVRAYNSRGQARVASAEPVEGKPGFVRVTTPDGRTEEFDPAARIISLTNPQQYLQELDKRRDDARKERETTARVKLVDAQTGLATANTEYVRGAKTAQSNAAATRTTRQPESRESIDRAHQSVDQQIQRLSAATDPNNRQIIDTDTKKPAIDQRRANAFYALKSNVENILEDALGRELGAREIRILGQHLATAPLDDAGKQRAWVEKVTQSIVGRPSGARGAPAAAATGAKPPVEGARYGRNPNTGEEGWFIEGPDGSMLWSPSTSAAQPAASGRPGRQANGPIGEANAPGQGATPAGLERRPAARPPASPEAVLSSISVTDQRAAQAYEQENPQLRRVGDALRIAASSRAPGMQSEATMLYQQYVDELRKSLGITNAAPQIAVPNGASASLAGLQRSAQ